MTRSPLSHRLLGALFPLVLLPAVPAQAPTLQQARQLIGQGNFAGAEAALREIVALQPELPQGNYLLGYALHAQGKLDEALAFHVKAAGFPQTRASASYNAACAYSLQGHLEDAAEWLGKAVAAGFRDREQAFKDQDLANLRGKAGFADLLPPVLAGKDLFVEDVRVIYDLQGEAAGDQFGWVARIVGDLDGDGVIDFATSAPTKVLGGQPVGRAYVYSGRKGELLFQVDGQFPGERFGNGVAPAGDVNGDGAPDVLFGAPGLQRGTGRVVVCSGSDGAQLLEVKGEASGSQFGLKVCSVGDLDGDGRSEIAVGAPTAGTNGRAYVFNAAGHELFRLDGGAQGGQFGSALDATTDAPHMLVVGAMKERGVGRAYVYGISREGAELSFTIDPDTTSVNLGQYFVSIPGDCDGDGYPDIYASDWNNSAGGPQAGRVFVHSGKTGERLLTLTGQRPGEGFGTSPSQAGDVDGDGHADLIVGAWQNNEGGRSAGKCYLHSGADGKLLRTFTCRMPGDTLGFDAQGIGDVDGDGAIDFLITSAWSPIHGVQTGRVLVLAGEKQVFAANPPR